MSRVKGTELSDANMPDWEKFYPYFKKFQQIGRNALAGVGIDPSIAHWDTNMNNFIVPSREGTKPRPLTVIDQQASRWGSANDWGNIARPKFDPKNRDARDISAERSADDAWDRLGPTLTKV